MPSQTYLLFYVESPVASAAFYTQALSRQPVEVSPTFALFILDDGTKVGLWSRHTVEPAARPVPDLLSGGSELALTLPSRAALEDCHTAWQAAGVPIAQAPVALDFGYTFVGLDPDGHRLRMFVPERGDGA
ncbi:VOC family protein [Novispirillum itersonii subsp. nipponicum]